jgi:uncharacterized DUF497 family protein
MRFDGFDWDAGNRDKCRKHGVSTREIESLFASVPRVGPDVRHSDVGQRYRAVGRTADGRHLFVVFTLRQLSDGLSIRPISARYMHRKEVEAYEKEIP